MEERMNRQHEFLKLLLTHQVNIKAFIGALVPDRHLRDDVFQEVAVTLWEEMDSYDWDRPFAPWARGIAARKIMRQRDQDARFPLVFSPASIEAVLSEFERTDEKSPENLDALRECLRDLPSRSRDLLALRYERNLPCEQIARLTRRTLDAVYQVLSRLRSKLEDCIRQKMAR
jgi:RNA polymerase sigma-70 factor (ECF subfamily)